MDTFLYQDALEALNKSTKECYDSGNKADSEPESLGEEDKDYEINPSLDFNKSM